MKVKMLTNKRGSPDGLAVKTYEGGKVYKLPKELALAFIQMGVAKERMQDIRVKKVEVENKEVIIERKEKKKKNWKKKGR